MAAAWIILVGRLRSKRAKSLKHLPRIHQSFSVFSSFVTGSLLLKGYSMRRGLGRGSSVRIRCFLASGPPRNSIGTETGPDSGTRLSHSSNSCRSCRVSKGLKNASPFLSKTSKSFASSHVSFIQIKMKKVRPGSLTSFELEKF